MADHCSQARFVWNVGLEQRKFWSHSRKHVLKSLTAVDQHKELALVRKWDDWLGSGSSIVQQQALRELHQAYVNWWKNPQHFGPPTWRKKHLNESFRLHAQGFKVRPISKRHGEVFLAKVGWVKFRRTRPLSHILRAKSVVVKLDRQGRWHVSFTLPQPEVVKTASGRSVGVDAGVVHTVTTSDGKHHSPEGLRPKEQERLVRLERKLARQQKGSNRREQTRLKIAKLKGRKTARRRDWNEKTTTGLVREFDFVGIENLSVKNMMKSASGTVEEPGTNVAQKRGLNRSISEQGWGEFRRRLEQKAEAATTLTLVVAVPPAYTSQQCFRCGHVAEGNRENQADFNCTACGHESNADVNAALNIEQAALREHAAGHAVSGHGDLALAGSVKCQPPETAEPALVPA